MSDKHYKIVSLLAENVKRLKVVEIKPDRSVVEITGKNGAGKSSLLDSIYWALSGEKAIQKRPIRGGEQKARVVLNMGDLIVTRKMTAREDGTYSTTLTVESDDGMLAQKPQNLLNKIVGELTADPLAFIRMKPEDQFDQLKQFVQGFDFEDWAVRRKKVYAERTDQNRIAKEYTAMAGGVPAPEGEPPALVDEAALVAALDEAGAFNAGIERRKANRDALQSDIDHRKRVVDHNQARILQLEAELAKLKDVEKADLEWLDENRRKLEAAGPLPDPIDTAELRQKITDARTSNQRRDAHVRQAALREQYLAKATAAGASAGALTKQIEAIDAEKTRAIAASKMPVDGIGFGDDDTVTLNGYPFDQASMAEQLRASVALAMAANPNVRILLVRDGSLLDEDSFKLLAEMAAAQDFQVWLEVVESGRPEAIVIEDGAVRAKEEVPANA